MDATLPCFRCGGPLGPAVCAACGADISAPAARELVAVEGLRGLITRHADLPGALRADLLGRLARARAATLQRLAPAPPAPDPGPAPPRPAPDPPPPPARPLVPEWLRDLAPVAAENLLYLLGAFLLLAGAAWFASTAWTTMSGVARLLLVQGGLAAFAGLLWGAGHRLARHADQPSLAKVRRVTAHLAAAVTPIACVVAGRVLLDAPLLGVLALAATLGLGLVAWRAVARLDDLAAPAWLPPVAGGAALMAALAPIAAAWPEAAALVLVAGPALAVARQPAADRRLVLPLAQLGVGWTIAAGHLAIEVGSAGPLGPALAGGALAAAWVVKSRTGAAMVIAAACAALAPALADPVLALVAVAGGTAACLQVARRTGSTAAFAVGLVGTLGAYLLLPTPARALVVALRDQVAAGLGYHDRPLPLAWYGLTCLPYVVLAGLFARYLSEAGRRLHADLTVAWTLITTAALAAVALLGADPRAPALALPALGAALVFLALRVGRRPFAVAGPVLLALGAMTAAEALALDAPTTRVLGGALLALAAFAGRGAPPALRRALWWSCALPPLIVAAAACAPPVSPGAHAWDPLFFAAAAAVVGARAHRHGPPALFAAAALLAWRALIITGAPVAVLAAGVVAAAALAARAARLAEPTDLALALAGVLLIGAVPPLTAAAWDPPTLATTIAALSAAAALFATGALLGAPQVAALGAVASAAAVAVALITAGVPPADAALLAAAFGAPALAVARRWRVGPALSRVGEALAALAALATLLALAAHALDGASLPGLPALLAAAASPVVVAVLGGPGARIACALAPAAPSLVAWSAGATLAWSAPAVLALMAAAPWILLGWGALERRGALPAGLRGLARPGRAATVVVLGAGLVTLFALAVADDGAPADHAALLGAGLLLTGAARVRGGRAGALGAALLVTVSLAGPGALRLELPLIWHPTLWAALGLLWPLAARVPAVGLAPLDARRLAAALTALVALPVVALAALVIAEPGLRLPADVLLAGRIAAAGLAGLVFVRTPSAGARALALAPLAALLPLLTRALLGAAWAPPSIEWAALAVFAAGRAPRRAGLLALAALATTGLDLEALPLPVALTILVLAPLRRAAAGAARAIDGTIYALVLALYAWLIYAVPHTGSPPAEILPAFGALAALVALALRALPLPAAVARRRGPLLARLSALIVGEMVTHLLAMPPAPARPIVVICGVVALLVVAGLAIGEARRTAHARWIDVTLGALGAAHLFVAARSEVLTLLDGYHGHLWLAVALALRVLPRGEAPLARALRTRALGIVVPALLVPGADAALLAAVVLGVAARQDRRPWQTLAGLALANLATARLWLTFGVSAPAFFGVPAGLSLLAAAAFERRHLTAARAGALQIGGLLLAYASVAVQVLGAHGTVAAAALFVGGLTTVAVGARLGRGDLLACGAGAVVLDVLVYLLRQGFAHGFGAALLLVGAGAVVLAAAATHARRRARS